MAERKAKNVFRELGFPDPDTHAAKAILVHQIEQMIKRKKLSQAQAAEIVGVSQPDISKMLKGQFRPFSIERLIGILMKLGRDVEIVVKPSHKKRAGRMTVAA